MGWTPARAFTSEDPRISPRELNLFALPHCIYSSLKLSGLSLASGATVLLADAGRDPSAIAPGRDAKTRVAIVTTRGVGSQAQLVVKNSLTETWRRRY